MSQVIAQPAIPQQYVMVPVRERNGLGVFGFFVALFGLIVPTGIVSLLGLMLCLIAIGRSPRGFAATGVVLGFIGAAVWITLTVVAVVVGLVGVLVAAVGTAAAFAITQPEVLEVTSDMVNVAIAVEEYDDENGRGPSDIAALGLSVSTVTDPWANRYRLVVDDEGSDIVSAGPDGTFDTDDDIRLTRLDRYWEDAFDSFEERMEDFGDRMERLNRRHPNAWRQAITVRNDRVDSYEARARAELYDVPNASPVSSCDD